MRVDSKEEQYRKALLKILEIGERHVDNAEGRRIADFREAIGVARAAVYGTKPPTDI